MMGRAYIIPTDTSDEWQTFQAANPWIRQEEEKTMETKSRYEVIAELEGKKRDLIKERDGLQDVLEAKQKSLRNVERQKADNAVILDRQMEDIKEDINKFEKTMEEKKATIAELIKSVDDSLERFNRLQKEK